MDEDVLAVLLKNVRPAVPELETGADRAAKLINQTGVSYAAQSLDSGLKRLEAMVAAPPVLCDLVFHERNPWRI